jgi:hypothetical protein
MTWGYLTKPETWEGAMPTPFKPPYTPAKMGTYVQKNYVFLREKLFDPKVGAALRQELLNMSEADLRPRIKAELDLDIPAHVRVMVVDIENGRANPASMNQDDEFYMLVLPPVPRKSETAEHKEACAWEGAWHHAIVDGYGM